MLNLKNIKTSIFAAAVATLAVSSVQAESKFSFGLWGDMPYAKAKDQDKMPAILDSINASDIAFSIYDGDIKDGSSKCTDDVFSDATKMFNTLKQPTVYIPGDNEWTDCHRTNNGGYDQLERLAFIRKTMFATPNSFGQKTIALEHQGKMGEKFVENTRFTKDGVIFVGINMPGSNNNKVLDDKECTNKSARTPEICATGNKEYEERDAANVAWVVEAFKLARDTKAPGLVIVWQGDPGFDLPETEELDERTDPGHSGYTNFLAKLVTETEGYVGQVLIVHGDTHFFKLDKPLYSPTKVLPNLTRLQTFGSPSVHWVRVSVDPMSANVFTIDPVIVKQK
ncbi:MAG: hypothetical protein EBU34_03680 [Alphaproteobacteria bacterium]|jgi:hypothetical protein|nr:hypothetical protein [Beijerinckiaceae bacterium]NBQ38883.1 hypothetical protein [Alphaproteobacteria bacterium]